MLKITQFLPLKISSAKYHKSINSSLLFLKIRVWKIRLIQKLQLLKKMLTLSSVYFLPDLSSVYYCEEAITALHVSNSNKEFGIKDQPSFLWNLNSTNLSEALRLCLGVTLLMEIITKIIQMRLHLYSLLLKELR